MGSSISGSSQSFWAFQTYPKSNGGSWKVLIWVIRSDIKCRTSSEYSSDERLEGRRLQTRTLIRKLFSHMNMHTHTHTFTCKHQGTPTIKGWKRMS